MIRLTIVSLFILSMLRAAAQGREPGATPAAADSVKIYSAFPVKKDTAGNPNEIQLEEIQIQGEVEKPSVIILPKRIEPEMEEDGLDRSFSKEIKKNTEEVPKPDKAISQVEPVKSIKKEIEKKRK
jgi:hypothetical protein